MSFKNEECKGLNAKCADKMATWTIRSPKAREIHFVRK